jgi:NAD(P)-dependent dehydrogenase (short-subunit alcohol dehydrogenase family)
MEPQCKVALITGGSSGIGLAAANELLCNEAYRVIITGLNVCKGKAAAKQMCARHGENRCCFIQMNVNCPKQFEDAFKEITTKFGGVDILMNNAGILADGKWELEIDTNLKSVVQGILLAFKYMPKNRSKEGLVINTSSVVAFDPCPPAPIYAASKQGILALTRGFGDTSHFSKNGVRVIALCPGATETGLLANAAKGGLTEEMGLQISTAFQAMPKQRPQSCGKAIIYMTKFAPPGSAWVVEGAQLMKLTFPDRNQFSEKIIQV